MIDLDELERKAGAAQMKGATYAPDAFMRAGFALREAEHMAAASPATVLALVRVVRAAMAFAQEQNLLAGISTFTPVYRKCSSRDRELRASLVPFREEA